MRDVGDGRDIPRTEIRILDRDGDLAARARRERPLVVTGRSRLEQRTVERRRNLARDAEHRQAIGPIRRDVEVEHRVGIADACSRAAAAAPRPARCLRARGRASTSARQSPPACRARRRNRESTTAGPSQPELLQEAQVVFVEQADVVDVPLEHRRRVRCPCRTRSRSRDRGRSRRARRPRDAPSRCRESPASPVRLQIAQPGALAADAADVDFGARLGVREEARPEAHVRCLRRRARRPSTSACP